MAAVGYSMGGAILLRCLGEMGATAPLSAAVAVNPPTDLAWCLRELEQPGNRLFHRYYVRSLRAGLTRRWRLHGDVGEPPDPRRHDSVRAMDEDYIAPDAGYPSAEAYYAGCSARVALAGIRVPTLVLSARDDPFVPAAMLRRDLADHPRVRLELLAAGGHMGYLEWRRGRLAFWAAGAVLDVLEQQLGLAPGNGAGSAG
jgi:predicted alpha/beta-fold hydrolase